MVKINNKKVTLKYLNDLACGIIVVVYKNKIFKIYFQAIKFIDLYLRLSVKPSTFNSYMRLAN